MPLLSRILLVTGSLSLLIATQLSAIGFHALDDVLTVEKRQSWDWATELQMVHSLGLIAIALLAMRMEQRRLLAWAGACMTLGLFLFSGSIYLECLGAPAQIGQVAPFGGTSFMAGWLLLAIAAVRAPRQRT